MYILKPYDDALRNIYVNGFDIEGDRTGVGTRCLFGISTQYDVSEYMPILVYRKAFWKSIVKEFLWYIKGSHLITDLEASGSKIWSAWKNDVFTQKNNLPDGSGGYIYGYNLINFGGDINDPSVKGFNQLDDVINKLKNPKTRQACFTFWRPDTNHKAILPACHAFYSFIVSPDSKGELNTLNLHIFQRSNDFAVGISSGNLLIGSLFIYTIAQQTGLKVGTLYHTGSHCHIYHNAMDAVKEYLDRIDSVDVESIHSPRLILNKKDSIYDYTIDDFDVVDYTPLSKIDMPLAV